MGVVGDPVREARLRRYADLRRLDKDQLISRLMETEDRLAAAEQRESDRSWVDNPPQGGS